MPVRLLRRLTGTALRAAFRSRSAVDARKAPASPNGHGPPGRLSVAASAGGPSLFAAKREKAFPNTFPPSPPSLPQRAFAGEKVRDTRPPRTQTQTACTDDFYPMELFAKWVLSRLELFQIQTIRPVVSRKKRVFSARFGLAALCRRFALCLFPWQNALKTQPPFSHRNTPQDATPGCSPAQLRMTKDSSHEDRHAAM